MPTQHNPIDPITKLPFAIPGCFCRDCEAIREWAEVRADLEKSLYPQEFLG